MLTSRKSKLLAVVILIGIFVLVRGPGPKGFFHYFSEPNQTTVNAKPPSSVKNELIEIDQTNTDQRFDRFTDGTIHWKSSISKSRQLNETPSARDDFELIEQIFSAYRLIYKENPVGTENFEFVEALLGKNPKRVYFIAPDHPAVTSDQQLLDRWGTPYRFHPVSGKKLEIHSAGTDREWWTEDDIK